MSRQLLPLLFFVVGSVTAQPVIDPRAGLAEIDARAKAHSHCSANEAVVFTCNIGPKIASVCASIPLNAGHGYLQYRFGEKNGIELEIPEKLGYEPESVGFMNGLTASAYATYLRFRKGSYRYYVFTASVRGPDDPKSGASTRIEPSGIAAMKGGKKVYWRRCSTPAFDHNLGERFLGKGVATLRAEDDVDPFELAFPAKP